MYAIVNLINLIEPVGHVKPRVANKFEMKEISMNSTFVAICSGQSFPVPKYR